MIVTNSRTGGGAERSMNLACNELSKRGWPISLVPINSSPNDQVTPNCEVFPLERQWRGGLISTLTAIWKFQRIINDWKPEVIVLNCDLPELFGATQFSRSRLVVVEHVDRPWITRMVLGRVIRRILKLRKAKWVAVSSHLLIWPNSLNPDAILPNSILTSQANLKVSNKFKKTNRVERLIFIGRLAPQKRPDWMIKIGKITGIPVSFIGDGAMRESMQSLAIASELNFTFHGRLEDPWAAIEVGDLLIVPSEYEGDGLVVIEGIQKGMPMLISDIPDFRRFRLSELNYCRSIQDFANSIIRFRTDISSLLIPPSISTEILFARSPKNVGDVWEEFLHAI